MGDVPHSQSPKLHGIEPPHKIDYSVHPSQVNADFFSDAFDYSFLYDGSLQLPLVKRNSQSVMKVEPIHPLDFAFAPIRYTGEAPDKYLFPTEVSNESLFADVLRPTELFSSPSQPLLKPPRHPICFPKPGAEFKSHLLEFSQPKMNVSHFFNANSTGWPYLPHNLYSFLKPRGRWAKKKVESTKKWRPRNALAMPLEKAHDILKLVRDLKPRQATDVQEAADSRPKRMPGADFIESGSGYHISRQFYGKKHPDKYDDLLKMPILVRIAKVRAFFKHIGISANGIQRLIGTANGKYGNHQNIRSFLAGDCTNAHEHLAFRIYNLYLNLRYSPEFVVKLWDFKTIKYVLHRKYTDGKIAMWAGCPNVDELYGNCECTTKSNFRWSPIAATKSQDPREPGTSESLEK